MRRRDATKTVRFTAEARAYVRPRRGASFPISLRAPALPSGVVAPSNPDAAGAVIARFGAGHAAALVAHFATTRGLAFALQAMVSSTRFVRTTNPQGSPELFERAEQRFDPELREGWDELRARAAAAGDDEYRGVRATAESLRAEAPLALRCAIAYVFPSEPAWSKQDVRRYFKGGDPQPSPTFLWLLLASLADAKLVADVLRKARSVQYAHVAGEYACDLVATFGVESTKFISSKLDLDRCAKPEHVKNLTCALDVLGLSQKASRPVSARRVSALYGFEFPDDFYRFWEYANSDAGRAMLLGKQWALCGAFDVLAGKFRRAPALSVHLHSRTPQDPPEFFGLIMGPEDGEHYGYFFDAPGDLPPRVAGFHSYDERITDYGDSLFNVVHDRPVKARGRVAHATRDGMGAVAGEPRAAALLRRGRDSWDLDDSRRFKQAADLLEEAYTKLDRPVLRAVVQACREHRALLRKRWIVDATRDAKKTTVE